MIHRNCAQQTDAARIGGVSATDQPSLPWHSRRCCEAKEISELFSTGKKAGLEFGYVPDFVVWLESLPVLVCEVKKASIDALVGFREAALYARHINTGAGYGHGIQSVRVRARH